MEEDENRIDKWWTSGSKCLMSNVKFVTWLWHFVDFVKPTKEETLMLIFDSHVTHAKSLAATEMAREAGVFMVSLLPNTAHRL